MGDQTAGCPYVEFRWATCSPGSPGTIDASVDPSTSMLDQCNENHIFWTLSGSDISASYYDTAAECTAAENATLEVDLVNTTGCHDFTGVQNNNYTFQWTYIENTNSPSESPTVAPTNTQTAAP